ncbi:MAG: HvfA family oxazolone/thioamide-modified RiPP metallophore, partial [Gammaproteobacteria bacterium]
MAKKPSLKPVSAALGTTFAVTLAASPLVNAEQNPFSLTNLESGYMVAGDHEGKCGEGKCGGDKEAEGKCGGDKEAEGKCGG